MIALYVELVVKGVKKLEDVPAEFRAEVKKRVAKAK